jgi:hypothetical protein
LKVRFWKGLDSDKDYEDWKATMEEVRESLREQAAFKTLDDTQQKALLSGQQLCIKGMRATLKRVGIDET